jgi:hypothetical protein
MKLCPDTATEHIHKLGDPRYEQGVSLLYQLISDVSQPAKGKSYDVFLNNPETLAVNPPSERTKFQIAYIYAPSTAWNAVSHPFGLPAKPEALAESILSVAFELWTHS